jgi:DNA sulfur modification protein DndD
MFIDQIILHNFRVYYGPNEVLLSLDKEQHISVIAGNNGFGKTSFLTGLVWGLYGKMMADVDQRYRQEILESGGYKKYCEKLMNRLAFAEANTADDLFHQNVNLAETKVVLNDQKDLKNPFFSVTIKFSNLLIPSVPCQHVQVTRTCYINDFKETVEILIDGMPNELTRGVGPEIFINDFILPKEIAKFFFFDAEKIVSLSEIKSADEKKFLSQAYAEVLGIKKYTDLKSHLENVRLRLRDKSADKSDRLRLSRLQAQFSKNEKLIGLHKDEIIEKSETLLQKRIASDKYQEQLIREGSGMTIEELKKLRETQFQLQLDLAKNKYSFNELLELAPFAIATSKMKQIIIQLELEASSSTFSHSILNQKFEAIRDAITLQASRLSIFDEQKDALLYLIGENLLPINGGDIKTLLDFSTEQQNKFLSIVNNLKEAYNKHFRNQLSEQKRLQSLHTQVQKKLQDAESKEKDSVVSAIRRTKMHTDSDIKQLENEFEQLHNKVSNLQQENQSLLRQVSELAKHVKVEDLDLEKDKAAERLIVKLNLFIQKLKGQKKASLETNIFQELKRLMHKDDFVCSVKVNIEGDLIDIELFDRLNMQIDKELLSKGEQQLYATALLAALISESNIQFPVFIDSPLQKFDKQHSKNIITEFYPFIAEQVVLFPLLQKELNEEEYEWLLPSVGKAFLIEQSGKYHSRFKSVTPNELFQHHKFNSEHV